MNKRIIVTPLCACLAFCAPFSEAIEVELGGFLKMNARHVNGDIAFQDSWTGGGSVSEPTQRTQFSAQESRLNLGVSSNDVRGFIEIDFVGSSQGNAIISNSYSPRLRHAFIEYQDVVAGQTWSTLVNTSAFAETADLGGPLVGQAMVRQALVRYTFNNWQFALENPYTYGTNPGSSLNDEPDWIDTRNDYVPDFIVRYNTKGDWGNVSASGVIRYLDPDQTQQVSTGMSVAGKLRTFGKDDLRIQLHYGNLGRYVGTDAAKDIIEGELETTLSAMAAYRHFWDHNWRTSLFIGHTATEVQRSRRTHVGVNLFTNLTPELSVGVEVGQYAINDKARLESTELVENGQSQYLQLSMQFSFQ
ncbi:hypothetical protein AN944_00259 [Shewanella sp. P1-14-1]|uniref:hypothetical protein n=1 Tax=Shewanella sp. P1-14-1 TaxID=1723761 RepID=UPI0006E5CF34|nr:hypothetical protein [Shewanella sp. P1-14-1]KPZ73111.1 hypothetical protein AN944_00259 [Shewanella sp. P1-14-1]